jgi:hypothetical protein
MLTPTFDGRSSSKVTFVHEDIETGRLAGTSAPPKKFLLDWKLDAEHASVPGLPAFADVIRTLNPEP